MNWPPKALIDSLHSRYGFPRRTLACIESLTKVSNDDHPLSNAAHRFGRGQRLLQPLGTQQATLLMDGAAR
jgi:hypothetical protein